MRAAALAAVLGLLAASQAHADVPPPTHVQSTSECDTAGGSHLSLPPGYFLPEETWSALDFELRRLQDSETRLTAENQRLRDLTKPDPMGTLELVGVSVLVGALLGGAAGYYFSR